MSLAQGSPPQMSPERLYRHDHPPDSQLVTWEDVREIGPVFATAVRHALIIAWIALAVALATGVATAILSIRQDRNTAAIARSACTFVAVLEDSETRERELAVTDRGGRVTHLQSADRLARFTRRARASGIKCPPPKVRLMP